MSEGSEISKKVGDCYEYVRSQYRVDAYIGVRVKMHPARMGTIARARTDLHYVHVLFDGHRHTLPCHPLDLEYITATAVPPESR